MGDPEPAPQRAEKVLVGVQFPGKGHPRPGLGGGGTPALVRAE